MARKKPWAVVHEPTGQHIAFFEYPIQAHNYIERTLNRSHAHIIRRLK